MCSIAATYRKRAGDCRKISETMTHRGPDERGEFHEGEVELCHNRLSVIDPENGHQPMCAELWGRSAAVVYNGELYNTDELEAELAKLGVFPQTRCDTEVLLLCYLTFGVDFVEKLNGIFSFVIYDRTEKVLIAARDRLGVKPLYYSYDEGARALAIASEMKGLLALEERPTLTREGLWMLLTLAPISLPEQTVYKNIKQLPPASIMTLGANGRLRISKYWQLKAHPALTYDPREAAEEVRRLLCDAVRRQLRSDVPLATFLSGGLDSSVLTAIAAKIYAERGERLSTYSFEYEGERENFRRSLFQPDSDDQYAEKLSEELGTNHTILIASDRDVANALADAEYFRDMPGQADIDSSLLYFCRKVKERHTVAISGECSDEIFGGYPWFYRPEMLENRYFPWMHDPTARLSLFRADAIGRDGALEFLEDVCRLAKENVPICDADDGEMIAYRRATVLSVDYFMTNLLERKDRMSMAASLEVRVPFADHRLIEFVYDLPPQIKFEGGVEKSLLRRAAKGFLPERILKRKKSPYPKTHSAGYERLVGEMLDRKLANGGVLSEIIDRDALERLKSGEDVTWMGQLMSRPQMLGWLYQLAEMLERYEI